MTEVLTRRRLLVRGGGVVLAIAGGSTGGAVSARAWTGARAATPDADLAYARLLVAVEHRALFTGLADGQRIGPAFAAPLAVDRVSDALDAYTS